MTEVQLAETAYLTAVTVLNVRDNGKASPEVRAAEVVVFDYLEAAKTAAESGDTVTASQKLGLFNQALETFNSQYVNVTTQP